MQVELTFAKKNVNPEYSQSYTVRVLRNRHFTPSEKDTSVRRDLHGPRLSSTSQKTSGLSPWTPMMRTPLREPPISTLSPSSGVQPEKAVKPEKGNNQAMLHITSRYSSPSALSTRPEVSPPRRDLASPTFQITSNRSPQISPPRRDLASPTTQIVSHRSVPSVLLPRSEVSPPRQSFERDITAHPTALSLPPSPESSRTKYSKGSALVSKSAQIDGGSGSIFSSASQLQRSSSPDLSKSARTKIKVSTAVSDSTVIKGVTPASGQATSSKEFAGYVGLVVTTSRPHAVKEV
jgi:hypothetical protein